jgi:hypothetical protein
MPKDSQQIADRIVDFNQLPSRHVEFVAIDQRATWMLIYTFV